MSSSPPTSVALAERLQAARFAANLSQKELAEQIGVSARSVQNWESGATPRPLHRRRLADFFATHENGAEAA